MSPAVAERLAEQAVQAIELPTPIGSAKLLSGQLLLCGWSVRETSGAAGAAFELLDGADNGGQLVASVGVPAADSKAQGPAAAGIGCEGGLYFRLVSGAITGVVWVRAFNTAG